MPNQSALDPAGRGAERLADLFWGMTIGGTVIWLAVVVLAIYAFRAGRDPHSLAVGRRLIVGAGVIVPTIVLAGLLAYSLSMLPGLVAAAPEGALRVRVIGEQWWWRVEYQAPDGRRVPLANEIRLPAGTPVEFTLASRDVVHSFWIPALGGKMDLIPGRETRLTLEPLAVGVYRGVCAEYCGASHALMAFDVVVEAPAAFDRWLAGQAGPAAAPVPDSDAARGGDLFVGNGCGACHSVRGTRAAGVVGPDLTHVGGRRTIGAGLLPADIGAIERWLAHPDRLKPGVHMPAFGMLPADDRRRIAAYLESLK